MPATSVAPRSAVAVRPVWLPPKPADSLSVDRLVADLGLPASLCRLLVRRGYSDPSTARSFLRPSRGHLHSPWRLAGMEAVVERLQRARRAGETVLVHGDYDVDGVCATALLVRALRMMGFSVVPFVPHRLRDGYDLTSAGIAAARRAGATLIVTADCGTVAHDAVDEAARLGIEVIVTDHHTPGAELPRALTVINPNRSDCDYPEKGLAGAGVAFKLVEALAEGTGFPAERLSSFLDLVAIATIADLAPLTSENRALVRWGLAVLARTPNPGLRALLRSCGLGDREELTAGHVGFVLAPRLNAAGRLGDAMRGVQPLLADDPRLATRLAEELELENRRRRELDEATLADAIEMLERSYDPERDWGVVLASDRWHPGVIGIVASRVVERIHRPTVLISLGQREGKGSGRSITGLHLQAALSACAAHLTRFGGHRAAAGCSLEPSRVEPFREAFNEVVRRTLEPEALVPRLQVDEVLSLEDANYGLLTRLRHFAPFGVANATPVFAAYGVRLAAPPRIVGRNHLRLLLASEEARLEAIGFGLADLVHECSSRTVDVAFRLEENRWNGGGRRDEPAVQARLVDVRAAG